MQVAKKLQLAVLVLVLSASNVFALTWQEALKVAEKNNHELISAQKQVEASEWSYRKAMSVFLPNLSAQASIGEATARASSYGLSVTQTLFDGTQNIYGLKSAYADLESEKASLAATRASVYYDLRSAFITLVIKQEQLKLYEQLLDQRLVADVAAHEAVAAGLLGLLDVASQVLEVAGVGDQVEVDDVGGKGCVGHPRTQEGAADEAGASRHERLGLARHAAAAPWPFMTFTLK